MAGYYRVLKIKGNVYRITSIEGASIVISKDK